MFFYIIIICGFISTFVLLLQKRREKNYKKALSDGMLVAALIFYWFSIIILSTEAFVKLGAAYIIDMTANLPPKPGDLTRGFNSIFVAVAMTGAMKFSLKTYRWLKIKSSLKKICNKIL